ncbi:uncharacterized protein [Blastocystis hominis]|uniref:MRG domain-containing protein n=1 Tax=Blastocystis hominis TaxID=12968 RepID=D8M0Z0_BLAHO|nr:uncharacterized protein [Blastocystis hominis]CBK21729.2 unnamed protein product [Blastocystis hominis]|eukprot:XP_012895777.1 uncharacterized protein [Blastocystis hominis]
MHSVETPSHELQVVCSSLLQYFDKFFTGRLLYKPEVRQLRSVLHNKEFRPPSAIYGPEHFLRLLFQYPQLVVHTDINENTTVIICEVLNQLFKYLESHSEIFLSMDQYSSSWVFA